MAAIHRSPNEREQLTKALLPRESPFALRNYILPGFYDSVGNLLIKADGAKRLTVEQAAQARQLRGQQVAFSYLRNNLPGCGFDFVQGTRQARLRHGYSVSLQRSTTALNSFLGAQDYGFHNVDLNHHIGNRGYDLLLISERHQEFL
jgi:hypothetical protein